jgi:hypothetical protein
MPDGRGKIQYALLMVGTDYSTLPRRSGTGYFAGKKIRQMICGKWRIVDRGQRLTPIAA